MADPHPSAETSSEHKNMPDGEAPPVAPRWVKVFGIVLLVLLLVIVVGLVTGHAGPGEHGPARHFGSGSNTPPLALSADPQ